MTNEQVHEQMVSERVELEKFLQEHYKDEISMGQHGGMTLVQVLVKYLGRERMYARDQIRREIPEPARVAKVKKKGS